MRTQTWASQLRKGLAEFLVMAALRREEAYGYQLLQRINAVDGLTLRESMVYPLLQRLANAKLVSVRQAPSPTGPPRRYYKLTKSGQGQKNRPPPALSLELAP